MAQRIPITQGNDFEVRLRPILMDGTIVDASLLTDRVVKVKHGITETTYTSTVDEDYICIAFDSTLQLGDYSVKITAKLGDQDVAANYGNLFSIVPFGMATPIVPVKGDLVIIGVSDEETEAYRQALVDAKDNYNTAAEALEDAKEELEEQAEALTDIAKESTLNNPTYGLQAIKTAIGNIPGGGGGGGGVTKAEVQDIIDEQTDTLEDDIDDVLTAATAAKTAAEAIVIPSNIATSANFEGLAQEGTSVAILESLGTDDDESVHDKLDSFAQELDKIGTPAEGQPSTLFEAIAAGGSGGYVPMSYPCVEMTATTATLQPNVLYIWGEVSALTITLAEPTDTNIVNEYMMQFKSGETEANITFTDSSLSVLGEVQKNAISNISIVNKSVIIA